MARRTKPLQILAILPSQCAEVGITASTPSETGVHGITYLVGVGRSRKAYRVAWDDMAITGYTVHGATYSLPV